PCAPGPAPSTTAATRTSGRCSPPGGRPLFVCRQTGTSVEMVGEHYGDARVDAAHLDEMIGEFDPSNPEPTRNPLGQGQWRATTHGKETLGVAEGFHESR